MAVLLAFTVEHAARAAGISERRVRYWDHTNVLKPSLASHSIRHSPFSRIYSFQDIVGLRTLGKLRDRHNLSLQKLREVGKWLRDHYAHPWSSLRFYVDKQRILFRDPKSGQIVATEPPGQTAIPYLLEEIANEAEAEVASLTQRSGDQIGSIVQNRYVLHNEPVLAGTRIPTAAIWQFHCAGFTTDEILREYPRLEPLDIARAIAFEQERSLLRKAG